MATRALLIMAGGWIVVRSGGGLTGLALISAGGLIVYGATLAVVFYASRMR
jgi:hypothetical protein